MDAPIVDCEIDNEGRQKIKHLHLLILKTIQISNNKYVHFSNENVNSPVIVSFSVSENEKTYLNINKIKYK